MTPTWLHCSLLAAVLALAVWNDVAARRIPNRLVASGLVAALVSQSWMTGGIGLDACLLGAATGLGLLLPLYLLRVLGAGDAKLMAVVGAFLGPGQAVGAVLLTFAAGGALSLAAALGGGSLRRVFNNLRLMLFVAAAGKASGTSIADIGTTGRVPYAVAIAAGTGLQVSLAVRGTWPFA